MILSQLLFQVSDWVQRKVNASRSNETFSCMLESQMQQYSFVEPIRILYFNFKNRNSSFEISVSE